MSNFSGFLLDASGNVRANVVLEAYLPDHTTLLNTQTTNSSGYFEFTFASGDQKNFCVKEQGVGFLEHNTAGNACTLDDTQTLGGLKTFSLGPVIQSGTDAAKPAAPANGRLYYATDTDILYIGDTAAWVSASHTRAHDLDGASDHNAGTQGDIIYAGAAGAWAKLAAGVKNKALLTGGAGANPSWAYAVPGLYYRSTSLTTVTNSATKTSILSFTLTGGDLTANGHIEIEIFGTYNEGNYAAGVTLTATLALDGVDRCTVASAALLQANGVKGFHIKALIANDGATNDQHCILQFGTGYSDGPWADIQTAAVDTTGNVTVAVSLQWSAAGGANREFIAYGRFVKHFEKAA